MECGQQLPYVLLRSICGLNRNGSRLIIGPRFRCKENGDSRNTWFVAGSWITNMLSLVLRIAGLLLLFIGCANIDAEDLSDLKKDQTIADFRVTNLYADASGKVVGAKFLHVPSKAPV